MTPSIQALPPEHPEYRIWNSYRLGNVRLTGIIPCPVLCGEYAALLRISVDYEVALYYPFSTGDLLAAYHKGKQAEADEGLAVPFISLAEFLLTSERVTHHRSGVEWMILYATAVESWNRFEGGHPPIGTTVSTLRSGYGGGPGRVLTVVGLTEHNLLELADTRRIDDRFHSDAFWFNSLRILSVPDQQPI